MQFHDCFPRAMQVQFLVQSTQQKQMKKKKCDREGREKEKRS